MGGVAFREQLDGMLMGDDRDVPTMVLLLALACKLARE
jgi:hypothetical protein